MTDLQPIDPKARIEILDVLRGFALLGILFNNILYFSGYAFRPFDELGTNATFHLDEQLYWFLDLVVTAKFYTLFCILFAVGFYLQLSRHTDDTSGFLSVYRRRLTILLAIGVLHSLFWFGDILALYALIGFVLIYFRNVRGKKLLRLAVFFIFLPTIVDLALLPFSPPEPTVPEGLAHSAFPDITPAAVMSIFKEGNIADVFSLNLHHLVWRWLSHIPSGRFVVVFGIFLLGYYLASINFFEEKVRSTRLLFFALVIGLSTTVVALAMDGNLYRFPPTLSNAVYKTLLTIGQISLCLFYVATIARLRQTPWGEKILSPLRPVGRMALTNYISQTLICVLIFYNFGLNLIGELGLVSAAGIAIGVLVFQVIISNLWLGHFRYGPLEWAWRSLTYREIIPIK